MQKSFERKFVHEIFLHSLGSCGAETFGIIVTYSFFHRSGHLDEQTIRLNIWHTGIASFSAKGTYNLAGISPGTVEEGFLAERIFLMTSSWDITGSGLECVVGSLLGSRGGYCWLIELKNSAKISATSSFGLSSYIRRGDQRFSWFLPNQLSRWLKSFPGFFSFSILFSTKSLHFFLLF